MCKCMSKETHFVYAQNGWNGEVFVGRMVDEITIIENDLDYETYIALRKAVGWKNFCREQVEKAINHSYYSVVIRENGDSIAMGRIIGDGLYFTIVDVVVHPDYQGKGLGTLIIKN